MESNGLMRTEAVKSGHTTKTCYAPDPAHKKLMDLRKNGEWDSLLALFHTPLKPHVVKMINDQLVQDTVDVCLGIPCSRLAGSMPSEKSPLRETRRFARGIRRSLRATPRKYRLMLALLRKKMADVNDTQIEADEPHSAAGSGRFGQPPMAAQSIP